MYVHTTYEMTQQLFLEDRSTFIPNQRFPLSVEESLPRTHSRAERYRFIRPRWFFSPLLLGGLGGRKEGAESEEGGTIRESTNTA